MLAGIVTITLSSRNRAGEREIWSALRGAGGKGLVHLSSYGASPSDALPASLVNQSGTRDGEHLLLAAAKASGHLAKTFARAAASAFNRSQPSLTGAHDPRLKGRFAGSDQPASPPDRSAAVLWK
jgi:hypothetical protein